MRVELTVNGAKHTLDIDPRTTLLDALRHHLQLTGTKKGCEHGQCGACTVLLNDQRINACLAWAVMHEDDDIITIEGLGTPESLDALQAAVVKHDGFQCGYCTPGQIMSATAMLREVAAGWPSHASAALDGPVRLTDVEISERMSGNLCRCGAYTGINAAIRQVAVSDGAGTPE